MSRLAIVMLLVLAACGVETVETTTIPEVAAPSTIVTTTTTDVGALDAGAESSSATTTPKRVMLNELPWPNGGRRLVAGVSHVLDFGGLQVEVMPPVDDWELLGYEGSVALFGWRGPSGFRPETLDVLVFDVGDDGPEAAWARIESLLAESLNDVGASLTWVDEGTAAVGGRPVEWSEVRTPDVQRIVNEPRVVSFSPVGRAVLWSNTSARVFVVPVGDLTVTVVAYETRCDCSFGTSWMRDDNVDDVENELSMWIDELEAFLGGMDFVGS